jgi:hypothetical protein
MSSVKEKVNRMSDGERIHPVPTVTHLVEGSPCAHISRNFSTIRIPILKRLKSKSIFPPLLDQFRNSSKTSPVGQQMPPIFPFKVRTHDILYLVRVA